MIKNIIKMNLMRSHMDIFYLLNMCKNINQIYLSLRWDIPNGKNTREPREYQTMLHSPHISGERKNINSYYHQLDPKLDFWLVEMIR